MSALDVLRSQLTRFLKPRTAALSSQATTLSPESISSWETNSSPLNFSFSSSGGTGGMATPTPAAAPVSARANGGPDARLPSPPGLAPLATTTDVLATIPRTFPLSAFPPPGLGSILPLPSAAAFHAAEAARVEEATQYILDTERERYTDNSVDYFAHFSTPPIWDPPSARAHALAGATDENGAPIRTHSQGGGALNADGLYDGEPPRDPAPHDEFRTPRKRTWMGTPDPEEVRRGLQRLRTSNSRPSGRNGGRTRASCSTNGASNPWAGSGQHSSTHVWNPPPLASFNPVEASTPTYAADPSPDAGHLPLTAPRASQTPGRSTSSRPQNGRSGHEAVPHPDDAAPTRDPNTSVRPALGYSSMEVDEEAQAPRSPDTKEPREDKGKGRAPPPEEETVLTDQDADGEGVAATQDGWAMADLHEARQQSLQQAALDLTVRGRHEPDRHHQTAGAGPSGAGSRYASHRGRENPVPDATGDVPLHRTHERADGRDRYVARDDRPRYPPTASASGRYTEAPEVHRRREHAYFPLPNTRAAQYLDAHPSQAPPSPPFLPQRSPMSHSPHLQRAASLRDQRLSAAPEQFFNDLRRHDHSPGLSPIREDRNSRGGGALFDDPATMDWAHEEGEILPTLLQAGRMREDDAPTEPPADGFPTVHRDDPETLIRGMANDWVRELWQDRPGTSILVDVFNYRYSEDDAHNRRVAETLRTALEYITDETDFDVVPPEPEEGHRLRARELPTTWAVRGLTQRGVARALEHSTWSFPAISFAVTPRSAVIPTWLFMLEGFLSDSPRNIRSALMRVLDEPEMRDWMGRLVAANPDFAGWDTDDAVVAVLRSLRTETLQLTNGNYVTNVYMRSPTRDPREWRQWVAALRERRYRSFANGTGRVRYIAACAGCGGVNHPMHLCPFPRIRGWNGPAPGEGVFGERRRDNLPSLPSSRARGGGSTRPNVRRNGRRDENDAPSSSRGYRSDSHDSSRGGGGRDARPRKGPGGNGNGSGSKRRH